MLTGEEKQEIIIIKRGRGGGDGHHGGAWKIAFADFMTAMMALFLVLWLVNAANEKTKKSVASYFNPVKLIDRTRSTKGLEESTSNDLPTEEEAEEDKGSEKSESENAEVSEVTVKEEDFFKDPFSVMDELANEEMAKIEVAMTVSNEFYEASPEQEDALLDPFAEVIKPPDEQQAQEPQLTEAPVVADQSAQGTSDLGVPQPGGLDNSAQQDNFVLAASLKVDQQEELTDPNPLKTTPETQADSEGEPKAAEQVEAREQADPGEKDKDAKTADVEQKAAEAAAALKKAMEEAEKQAESEKLVEETAKEIREQIKQRLVSRLGQSEQISESLSVKITDDGVLISITDQFGFSMFQVGSAIPKGEVVLAMAEISNVLSERKGNIRVYGHTDARPYASDDYDNWRLSTARAHAARLMLERGGLREARVSQVVGFSDRVLRTPSDPEADENRRIEILLEVL
ncbi:MAG: MotB family protein [Rhizobiaceae bacterium]